MRHDGATRTRELVFLHLVFAAWAPARVLAWLVAAQASSPGVVDLVAPIHNWGRLFQQTRISGWPQCQERKMQPYRLFSLYTACEGCVFRSGFQPLV